MMDNTTFESFESAAETIKETVGDFASDVSDKVDDLLGDAQRLLKAYPAAALIGAVVIGFAAGRLLRRD